jgi:hypothetical protein
LQESLNEKALANWTRFLRLPLSAALKIDKPPMSPSKFALPPEYAMPIRYWLISKLPVLAAVAEVDSFKRLTQFVPSKVLQK